MARKVIAHLFSSANGVNESPNLWQFDAFGPEEGEMMGRTFAPVTDVVIGRTLWQEWSNFWPTVDDGFGSFINAVPKHVITTTLSGELPWNSTIVDGDAIEYVRALATNGQPGDITVVGGIETVRSLFLGGVVDALTLTVHPVVVGQGKRLFDDSIDTTRLRLVECVTTSAGNLVVTYALRGE